MKGIIVSGEGTPLPPSDILRRLKQVDDRLDMVFMPSREGGHWAIVERWGPNDQRRAMIQRGDMDADADFDMIGYAPVGVSVDDAFGILSKGLRRRSTDRASCAKMLDNLLYFNKARQEANKAPIKEFAAEMLDANAANIGKKIISREAGFSIDANGNLVGTPVRAKHGRTKSERDAQAEMSDR